MHLIVLYRQLGPYHRARLRALAAGLDDAAVLGCEWVPHVASGGADCPVVTLSEPAAAGHSGVAVWRRVQAALRDARADVVAVPGWSDPLALAAVAWARLRGLPVVLMADSTAADAARQPWREWLKRRVVALADAALVAGHPHQDYVVRLGMPAQRVCLGYDVVDNGHFAAGAAAARADAQRLRDRLGLPRRFFLASARFVPRKDLPLLLTAFARYRAAAGADAWHLVVLGDGPLRGRCAPPF
jgi:Threonine dehydrogenase and related Zn-dependent dehydrogenases